MRGHLVIADISGYTRFLTESELEHANGIIGDLLNAIIAAIDAPLVVSRIEGDAIFMYGEVPEGMAGLTVLESVERLYAAFAGSLETMVLNTTCRCNACANIGSLGLKIVMHCGEYAVATVGGIETLSGTDVIVAHRMLKNEVREVTGIDDYLLVTEACVADLDIGSVVDDWVPHEEQYEDVGTVRGWVTSLEAEWLELRGRTATRVSDDEAWLRLSRDVDAPPAVVWDHLVDPTKRTVWLDATENRVTGDVDGRIGPGAQYHCAHGDGSLFVFTVVDRRPMEYFTVVMAPGNGMAFRYTDELVPRGDGTTVVSRMEVPFWAESGERIDDPDVLEEARAMLVGYGDLLGRLADLAETAVPA